jgi:hypothetical protein
LEFFNYHFKMQDFFFSFQDMQKEAGKAAGELGLAAPWIRAPWQ